MTRFKFLKTLGLRGGALMAACCMGSCTYNDLSMISKKVDFTLDLMMPDNSALKTRGGFVVQNDVVVAFTNEGDYVAVTVVCSHEGYKEIVFDYSRDIFSCNRHGAEFDTKGKGLNARGIKGLKTYSAINSGNSLRITG